MANDSSQYEQILRAGLNLSREVLPDLAVMFGVDTSPDEELDERVRRWVTKARSHSDNLDDQIRQLAERLSAV